MAHEVLRGGEEVWIHGNLAAPELAQVFRALGKTLKTVKVTNSNLFPDTTELSERVTTVKLVTNSVDEIEAEVRKALSVREIGLDQNNLLAEHVAAVASTLESFPMLQKLSLRGETAGDIGGKALGDLLQSSTSLRVLEVDCCKLGIEGLPHLARGITHSTSLRELYLSCQGTPNYEVVCHPVTQLLFDSFRANQSLKTLRLEKLGLDDAAAARLYDALSSCENLRVLDLTNNRLHAMTLVDLFLEHNESLEEFVLVRNNIDNAGAQTLADGVLRHPRLLRLELWKNPISDEGFAALCKSAGEHPSLEYLNLCSLNPNVAGINSLTTIMNSNRLQQLNLHECGLGNHGAACIATGLAATRHLVLLNLKHNKIGAEGANALGAGLAQNTTLEKLLLGENELGDAGAAALSRGLGTHPRLRIIDLGDNQIGDAGACALGACLKTNKVLQDLILWYNHIGEVGTQGLAEGLGTLQALLLGNNKNVGDAGALAVAGRLGSLRVIDMFATSLTDRGVTALANALIESPYAREFSVNNVTVTDEGALALANLLRRSKTLTQIGLNFKNMGRVGIEALSSALEANFMVTGDVEFLGMGMFADMANEDEEDDDEDGEEVMNPWADVMEYHFRLNATMAKLRAQLQVLEKSLLEMRFTLYICSRICLMSAFEELRPPHDGIALSSGTASSSTISADGEASPHVIAKLQRIAKFQDRIVAARAEIRDIFIRVPLISQFLVEVDFIPPPFPSGHSNKSNKRRKLE